jgi:D-proline reductase (dithiol) PrdB
MRPADLPLTYRLFLRTYAWRRCEAVPSPGLRRPIAEARVALVTSAGLVLPGDPPFDLDARGGDCTFRTIPADAALASLSVHHRSSAFERSGLETDRNVAFPLDRLHALAAAGVIGAVAPRHVSFMGSITAPGPLISDSAPAAAALLAADQVDVALLVPV